MLRLGVALLFLLYPLLVYFGLRSFQPRLLACLLVLVLAARLQREVGSS